MNTANAPPLILFIDPVPGLVDRVKDELQARYEVAIARDAVQALEAAHERVPDLILHGLAPADEQGSDVSAVIHADPALRDVPIVMILSQTQDALDGTGGQRADDYIDASCSARDLIGRIEVNLRFAQLRRESARREAELRTEAEALLRRIEIVLTHLPFGLTMVDPDGKILYANPARDKLLGHAGFPKAGDQLAERLPASRVDGTPLPVEEYPIRRALQGEFVMGTDIRYEYGNAPPRWIRASGIPVRRPDNTIQYAIGVAIDISPEMEARLELLKLTETLEERVRSEIEERLKAEETLRQVQKLQAIGQLTGGIAHDFNNLLQVMIGNLDATERSLSGNAPLDRTRIHRQIAAALRGAERAAQLTQQLLAFARRQPLDPTAVDVNRLVLGMTELLRRTLGESIVIEPKMGTDLKFAFADPNQLESALLNLAVNARDAMMPGGGRLVIETANCSIDKPADRRWEEFTPGDYVMIAVTDTGTGISPEIMPHIFEPFFTTKAVGQGTGLGLSQVYGFSRQSGGHIQIDSDVGVGTRVRLYLPAKPKADDAEEGEAPTPAPPVSAGEVILVVEDDPDVRAFSVEMLREFGYEPIEAADGPEALRRLESDPRIRLIFTDVGLPGMSGRQLADAAAARWPYLKVLFTTGYARDTIVHHGRLDPGVALITKPFTAAALAAKLRELIEANQKKGS